MSNRADLGIYFGGSSMTIAYSRDEKVSVIVNEAGDRYTPSILGLNESEFSVGLPAKQNLIRNSKNTVLYTKHFISKELSQIDPDLIKRNDCQIEMNKNNDIIFIMEKNEKPYELTLDEAIGKKLNYMFELAKSNLGVKECDAVFSVPKYFSEKQTDFLRECAKKTGFNVLRMIRNPVAACLAYDLEDYSSNESLVLVYQMGGNSIEVSLVSLLNGMYRILDSMSLLNVGGDRFTELIIDVLCEEFQRKNKSNPKENKRSVFKLKSNAEELKQILSTMERAHCSIDALYDGVDFDYYLTRQRFESVSSKLYQQVLQPIDDLLIKNNLKENQINQVILVGASTKMCKLQALIKQKFTDSKIFNYLSPDEIVSMGCAKQCALITNSKVKKTCKEDLMFKCLSNPISLKIGNNRENIQIFKSYTPLPVKKNINFEFDLNFPFLTIYESEDKILAKIHLNEFKNKEIGFFFQIKINETIEITVTENADSNNKISAFLNSDNND